MPMRHRKKGVTLHRQRYEYEDETNVRSARGNVTVADGVRWLGEVVVPMVGERALIQVERRPEGTGPSDATLAVLFDEIDAVLTVLEGVVAQARRTGVLLMRETATQGRGTAARRRRVAAPPRDPAKLT